MKKENSKNNKESYTKYKQIRSTKEGLKRMQEVANYYAYGDVSYYIHLKVEEDYKKMILGEK